MEGKKRLKRQKRQKRQKQNSGAVSIFLVLILVPMLLISSIFVDASKLKLGRSVAQSAGDLTINTALTDYDTQLKEMYGLFATAQNTEDLFDKLEGYYRTCIISSGVDAETTDSYVDQIMSQLGMAAESDKTSDLLNMELVDFEVSKRSDTSLAKAAVMKKQLVDFMKYRAPINTGLSFLSSLKSFTTLSKQTELVDKRTEYYEEEQSVMEDLKSAWNHINTYNGLQVVTDGNFFTTLKDNLNSYKDVYKNEVNRKTIMDLYDTQNYTEYHCSVEKLDFQKAKDANGIEHMVNLWHFTYPPVGLFYDYTDYYKKSLGGYDKNTLPELDDFKSMIKYFYENLESVHAARDSVSKEPIGSYKKPSIVTYDLQYLVQGIRKGDLVMYTGRCANLYLNYQKLKNAMIWLEAYEDTEKTELKNEKLYMNGKWDTIEGHFADIEEKYERIMQDISVIAKSYTEISENGDITGKTNITGVNDRVEGISTYLNGCVETLENAAKELDAAVTYLKKAKDKVKEGGSLSVAKGNWKAAASDKDLKNTSMAKQDQAEIDQLGVYLNEGEIDKLIGRLERMAECDRTCVQQIKGYKYFDKPLGEISGYGDVEALLYNKIGDGKLINVPVITDKLIKQADEWFEPAWMSGGINISWTDDSGKQPDLTKDKCNMYSYLYTHFNKGEVSTKTEKKEEDPASGENLYKDVGKKSDSVASGEAKDTDDGNIETSNEISKQPDLPSAKAGSSDTAPSAKVTTGDSAVKDTGGSLSSMFGSLAESLVSMGTDLRDKLYVADYAMSMFSYDTIEKEYTVEHPEASEVRIMTLTQQPINADNNLAYGREVEYIIYGGSNASNLAKSYGSIFGIRLGFNLIYAFMDSSIRDSAFAIATPISAATLGVIPVPLIQAAIIVGIALCESAIDLNDLRSGEKVPLFKTSDTWHCSVKGLISEAKGEAGELMKEAGKIAVDAASDKISELLDMSDEELDKFLDEGEGAVTSHIEEAYNDLITRHANTALQQLTSLATTAVEKYRMDGANMKDYVKKNLNDWLTTEGNGVDKENDLSYIVKKEAVNIICSGNSIDSLLAKLQSSIVHSEAAGAAIDGILAASPDNIDGKIADLGGELMGEITNIRKKIVSTIELSCEKVKTYKSKMIQQLKDSMKEGTESFKNALNEKIDGIFGSTGSGGKNSTDNTGIASLLAFSYSDYLRLFLMISLYTNEEGTLLRIGDVIQVNMAKKTGNEDYRLEYAATYVELSATLQVQPLMLALPLFSDVEDNPVEDTNWYTFTYKGIGGY